MLLFSVKELAGRGRGLVASQTIRKGSVALEDTAFAAVLNHGRAADDHCSFCFAPAADAADGGHGAVMLADAADGRRVAVAYARTQLAAVD